MDEDDTSDTEITRLEIEMHKFEAVFNMSSICLLSNFQFPGLMGSTGVDSGGSHWN